MKKTPQPNKTRRFYDIYLIILVVITLIYFIFIFSGSAETSFDKAKSFTMFSTAGFIILAIASFHFIYSLMVKASGGDMGWLGYLILTSAIIIGISPMLFYLFVFRKLL